MRFFVSFACTLVFVLTLNSCKRNNDALNTQNLYYPDSLYLNNYDLTEIQYSIPLPNQVSLIIKEDFPFCREGIFDTHLDISNYSTSEKKALVMGALFADLGYLCLYDQKDLLIKNLNNIRLLTRSLKFGQYNAAELLKHLETNLDNSDSILLISSIILKKEFENIRKSERTDLCTLIIAGGWIESFYILNTLSNNSKNSTLFGILLQQQYILDNLINALKPYYNKSREHKEITDKLIEIAYEFEVVDINYKNIPAEHSDSLTFVKCEFTSTLSGSQLNKMFALSGSIRTSLLY